MTLRAYPDPPEKPLVTPEEIMLREAYEILSAAIQVLQGLDVPDGRRRTARSVTARSLDLCAAIAARYPVVDQ